jgi:hypothetical protein
LLIRWGKSKSVPIALRGKGRTTSDRKWDFIVSGLVFPAQVLFTGAAAPERQKPLDKALIIGRVQTARDENTDRHPHKGRWARYSWPGKS